MKLKRLKFSILLGLLGLLLVTTACSQNSQTQQPTNPVEDKAEFVITPEGVIPGASTPTLIVRLSIKRLDDGNRFGKATFYWKSRSSTLNGTASVRLRKVDSSDTLTQTIDAPIKSNSNLYTDPDYKDHIAQTPSTTFNRAICLEITDWDLTTDDGHSLNNQTFPLTRCVRNSSETTSDMAVILDDNSKTTNIALDEEFPFVIGVENLGPRTATEVIVDVTLPSNISFIEGQSSKYDCKESSPNSGLVRCTASGDVPTGRVGLPMILHSISTGSNNVAVSVETTSIDPNSDNNSFNQEVSVGETGSCNIVSIPDSGLQDSIRETLNIPSDPICESDMLQLTELVARDSSISNLEGLQHAINLSSADFRGNQLNTISPSIFVVLTKLEFLNLSHNQIIIVPEEAFQGLTNLQTLYLSSNSKLATIPDSTFQGLINLQRLYISTNKLTSVPDSIKDLVNLKVLYLGRNQLTSVPESFFSELVNLETLSLSDNQISDISGLGLQKLTKLKRLALYNNQLTSIPTSVFQDLPNLQRLELYGNLITTIPESFKELTNLNYLALNNNKISDIAVLIDNTGLGTGDIITLHVNCLDITGPPDLTNIQILQDRGVEVDYDHLPQLESKFCP